MKIKLMTLAVVLLVSLAVAAMALTGKKTARDEHEGNGEQWEYLVVWGGNVNMTPSTSPTLRKQDGAFTHESYPLEGNLDKLGAKGWELVAVTGSQSDPGFVFKRHK